ncbi:NAD(P)/FAD-dependent oxidoreductase [Ruminococcus sp. CLA-AA-H200]|uniref:NAD(P)/FAD-dependent oxidoreductase n=1 Tax=Ruminococcus turbiniformis TaxID=2881258 RepID=A0ABS8FT39_9FIRM|nr:NAD(P)/FAD-dependent oxidoreductase [Ruminococcus turbiniformis]MCC2253205.1 NAD(P)/FAD-dependent oxidoreductase [Ruminococcus turbiniformis]
MRTVAVIGGGASGMMAAITAASEGACVILLEQKDRIGKKILSTGNGRCNFTNIRQEPICYHSDQPAFPWGIVEKFDARLSISFFLSLGVYSKNRNGYIYPNSDQASAVLDALRMELDRLGVEVAVGVKCTQIRPGKKQFSIETDNKTVRADRVILCAGSKAAPSTGSDGSGYDLAKQLGHRMVPVLPALVQLQCEGGFFKGIAGVRADGEVSVWSDGECVARDRGEIQLAAYGISGIPVFQVSRYASRLLYEKREVTAVLDFFPDFTLDQTEAFLKARANTRPEKPASMFLIGLFHKKLSDLWIKMSGISREKSAGDLTEVEIGRLAGLIKNFRVRVTGTNSFEQAQVCCGGIDTRDVNPETLESLIVPGLYFAGEILDVDGMCGGYNLQWAWASGHAAGKAAAGDRGGAAASGVSAMSR